MRKKDFFFTVVSLFSIITGILLCFYDFIIITLNPGTFLDNLTSFSHIWLIPGIYLIYAGIFRLKKQNSFFSSLPKAVKITEVILIFLFVIISIPCLYFILTPDQNPQPNADYVFLLGGGIDKNGVLPTNVLYRCETAVNYLQNNPNTQVIVTGGTLKFLPFPEAPAIKAALEEKGISSDRIIIEDQALDTIQNFQYSLDLIITLENITREEALNKSVVVVTNNFHLTRALRLAHRIGFTNIHGLAAKTAWYMVPHMNLREIGAYIKLQLRILLTGKP